MSMANIYLNLRTGHIALKPFISLIHMEKDNSRRLYRVLCTTQSFSFKYKKFKKDSCKNWMLKKKSIL